MDGVFVTLNWQLSNNGLNDKVTYFYLNTNVQRQAALRLVQVSPSCHRHLVFVLRLAASFSQGGCHRSGHHILGQSCSKGKKPVLPAFLLFLRRGTFFRAFSRHFLKSQPRACRMATLTCKESWKRASTCLFQSQNVRRRYRLERRGLWITVGI